MNGWCGVVRQVRRRDAVQQVTAKTQRALQEFYAKVRGAFGGPPGAKKQPRVEDS
jgi:hypothetical protein